MDSGLVGVMAGRLECSVVAVEAEELTGLGSAAVGAEIVPSVEAMVDMGQMFRRFIDCE